MADTAAPPEAPSRFPSIRSDAVAGFATWLFSVPEGTTYGLAPDRDAGSDPPGANEER